MGQVDRRTERLNGTYVRVRRRFSRAQLTRAGFSRCQPGRTRTFHRVSNSVIVEAVWPIPKRTSQLSEADSLFGLTNGQHAGCERDDDEAMQSPKPA